MTNDQILALAKEAGFVFLQQTNNELFAPAKTEKLLKFAKLLYPAERMDEEKVLKFYSRWTGGQTPSNRIVNFIKAICSEFTAPKAEVVYPEKRKYDDVYGPANLADRAYNSAIDEFKRLNGG